MKLKLSEIKLNKHNPRDITKENLEKLKKSIQDFPEMLETRPLIIDENNVVLGGNMRLRALRELGFEEVKVKQVTNWSEEKKKEFIVKDNVGYGEWDWEMLANEWEVDLLSEWGLDIPDWEGEEKLTAEEDDFEIKEDIKTDIVKGDIFEFRKGGKTLHRLMCGDSTSVDDVEKLMNGNKADMVFTDPPYGINKSEIKNDDFESFKEIVSGLFRLGENTKTTQLWVFGMFPEYLYYFEKAKEFLFTPYQQLIFIKPVSRETKNKITDKTEYFLQFAKHQPFYKNELVNFDFQNQFLSDESLLMYEQAKNDPEKWKKRFKNRDKKTIEREIEGKKSLINLFALKTNLGFANQKQGVYIEKGLGLHPTQKPPEQLGAIINTCSSQEWILLDPFLGSGSTMVASHQLKRKCYGMELDEKYCQVIVDRMKKLDPELEIVKI